MPNFKIIQDVADQARVKIYGSENQALKTDSSGYLAVTATTGGLLVTADAAGLTVKAPTGGVLVTADAAGLLVTSSADGLTVKAPTGGLLVTASSSLPVISSLSTTDVVEPFTNVSSTNFTGSTTRTVLGYAEYSFGIVNNTTDGNCIVKLQISPDGSIWFDNGSEVTLTPQTATALVSSMFLKYARVYYAAANEATPVDLTIYFQAQTS